MSALASLIKRCRDVPRHALASGLILVAMVGALNAQTLYETGIGTVSPIDTAQVRALGPDIKWEIWLSRRGAPAASDPDSRAHWGSIAGAGVAETLRMWERVRNFAAVYAQYQPDGFGDFNVAEGFGPVAITTNSTVYQDRLRLLSNNGSDRMAVYVPLNPQNLWQDLARRLDFFSQAGGSRALTSKPRGSKELAARDAWRAYADLLKDAAVHIMHLQAAVFQTVDGLQHRVEPSQLVHELADTRAKLRQLGDAQEDVQIATFGAGRYSPPPRTLDDQLPSSTQRSAQASQPYPSQPLSGQPPSGQLLSGQPVAGQPLPSQAERRPIQERLGSAQSLQIFHDTDNPHSRTDPREAASASGGGEIHQLLPSNPNRVTATLASPGEAEKKAGVEVFRLAIKLPAELEVVRMDGKKLQVDHTDTQPASSWVMSLAEIKLLIHLTPGGGYEIDAECRTPAPCMKGNGRAAQNMDLPIVLSADKDLSAFLSAVYFRGGNVEWN